MNVPGIRLEPGVLLHELPGRLRVRLPSIRHDPRRAAEIESRLAGLDVLHRVAARARSGSLVVEYDADLTNADAVLAAVSAALGVEVKRLPGDPPTAPDHPPVDSDEVASRIRQLMSRANRRVAAAAGGVDLKVAVPGALFFLGVGALLGAKHRRMPAWYDLIWYAYNTFQTLNGPAPNGPAPSDRDDAPPGGAILPP